MTIFGVDISHHQPTLDFAAMRREGIEFVFIKASEGTFIDDEFRDNLNRARSAGMLVGAYHYQRSNASAAAQVANIQRVVPSGIPVLIDVEDNSGGTSLTRDITQRLQVAGYHVPLLYIPRWYWLQLGQPSLVGLPPLWSSRYPDTRVGTIEDEWADVPAHYWTGYGGLSVAVLQFTSSARVAGYAPLDANAFRGTRAELSRLLGYDEVEDDDDEEKPMKNIKLAREAAGPAVWAGDGLTRRWVADEQELAGLQYWIDQAGGDSTIVEGWADLRVLGVDVTKLANDVADLKARPVADVDEVALAAELEARGITGITPQQVKDVIQAVFRDAGTDDAPPVTGVGA